MSTNNEEQSCTGAGTPSQVLNLRPGFAEYGISLRVPEIRPFGQCAGDYDRSPRFHRAVDASHGLAIAALEQAYRQRSRPLIAIAPSAASPTMTLAAAALRSCLQCVRASTHPISIQT